MTRCENCDKVFKTNWHLQRHLSKKVPCKKSPQNTTQLPQNTTQLPQNTTQLPQNTTHFTCDYCLDIFSRVDSLSRHKRVCTHKDDPVRILEIKLGIKISVVKSSTICRFCNVEMARKDSLTRHMHSCKAKKEYQEHLTKMLHTHHASTVNTNCYNNNITNTIRL